jgi:hypothetical protein
VGEYKFYCIGPDGHIVRREDYTARDDLDALDRARAMCGQYEIEVWDGARMISRVAKDGTASIDPPAARPESGNASSGLSN